MTDEAKKRHKTISNRYRTVLGWANKMLEEGEKYPKDAIIYACNFGRDTSVVSAGNVAGTLSILLKLIETISERKGIPFNDLMATLTIAHSIPDKPEPPEEITTISGKTFIRPNPSGDKHDTK